MPLVQSHLFSNLYVVRRDRDAGNFDQSKWQKYSLSWPGKFRRGLALRQGRDKDDKDKDDKDKDQDP
jgi:hypothetical protein